MTTEVRTQVGNSGVRVERNGPVATISLCRPDVLNAQTPDMWAALRDAGRDLPGDVRVVIVRGEGRALAAIAQLPPDEAADRIAGYQAGFTWLGRPDIVSIAAVQGHAIGAGFQLALACDLRILATDAKLAMAEVSLGLVPDLGGTAPLVRLVGYARALEICATGRRVGAEEALAMGLANLVVPPDELDDAVRDLTAALLSGARDAVVEIKALLAGAAAGRDGSAQLQAEREAQVRRIRDLAGIGE
jgi:enoyl-CoA hydratase/carnithine racemase